MKKTDLSKPVAEAGPSPAAGDVRCFVAFEDSEKLWENSGQFIRNMRAGVEASQIPLLVEVMHDFLDEVLDVFVLRPMERLHLTPAAQKTVDVTVATVKKSCHFLSRKILQRLANEDVRDLAEYMDELVRVLPGRGGRPAGHTALPISGKLAQEMNRITSDLHREDPPDCIQGVTDALLELLDVAVDCLYSKPLSCLRVGAVARKIIHVNFLTVHKVLKTALVKLVPHFSVEQLRAASGYFQGLIVSVPDSRLEELKDLKGKIDIEIDLNRSRGRKA